MQTTHKLAMVFLGVLVAVAAAAGVGFTVQQPADAQLVKDPGASGFAPGEDPKRPGWDPNGAPEDAPGHVDEGSTEVPLRPKDVAPGEQGLEAGIIGPEIKE
jgi:hypothetical protein